MTDRALSTRRILVLDDTASIHEDFRKALTAPVVDAGLAESESLLFGTPTGSKGVWPEFDLVFALQGEEGCRLAEQAVIDQRPFAVAFVDMRMPPGWDGVETIERLWQIDPRIQTVVCTAYSDYTWDQVVVRLGISDRLLIVKKPFDNAEVLQLATALAEKWILTGEAQLRMGDLERMVEERTAELRVTEERLRRSEKLEAIGRLAGGVAHDFNNLLAAIRMYAEFLRENTATDDIRRQDVDGIVETTDRATELTRQLLAIGQTQLIRPRVVDLGAMVTNVVPMLQRLIPSRIALTISLTPTQRRVMIDPAQVDQVVMNLVLNSRDAISGSGSITIEVREATLDADSSPTPDGLPPGDYVTLQVADTGSGIGGEVASQLFDPFFTTKAVGVGTGLGLSTAYGIIKQAGGGMAFTSTPGVGTTFCVYLPVTDAPESAPDVSDTAGPGAGTETILLVDDELVLRTVTRRLLERQGYCVVEAANGAEAQQKFDENPAAFSLILTDVVMPDMDGPTFVETLMRKHGPVRVIFMSGYTEDAATRILLASPNTAFLLKPFENTQLLGMMRTVLGRPAGDFAGDRSSVT